MLTKDDILEFRIFEGITLEELDAVISMSDEISYNAGEIILEESSFGSDSDFYVILQGNVKVELRASQSTNRQYGQQEACGSQERRCVW